MGNFYTNFTILNTNTDDVIRVAKELRRRAYIIGSPANNVVLFDQVCDEQDAEEIERLGVELSAKLSARVIGCLNHDDDYLLLWFFDRGSIKARYWSCWQALAFAWKFCRVSGWLEFPSLVIILGWPFYVFQLRKHHSLVRLLALPEFAVGFGYEYLSRGEIPDGLSEDDIIKV